MVGDGNAQVGLQTAARQSFGCEHKNKHENRSLMRLRPLPSSHPLIGRNGGEGPRPAQRG